MPNKNTQKKGKGARRRSSSLRARKDLSRQQQSQQAARRRRRRAKATVPAIHPPGAHRSCPITLPRNSWEINKFYVTTLVGQHSVFGSERLLVNHLQHLHNVARNVVPDYEQMHWGDENIESWDLLDDLRGLIEQGLRDTYGPQRPVTLVFDPDDDGKKGFVLMEALQTKFHGSVSEFMYMSFLEELEEADLHLFDIIAATVGHVARGVGLAMWNDISDFAKEHVRACLDDHQHGYIDDDDADHYRKILKQWEDGPAAYEWKCLDAARRLPRKKLEKVIRAYSWNTWHKKRILCWIRYAGKVLDTKRRLRDYCHNPDSRHDYMLPWSYMGFMWGGNSQIDDLTSESIDEQYNNSEQAPMYRTIDVESRSYSPLAVDPAPLMIHKLCMFGQDIFHNQFMKEYHWRPGRRKVKHNGKLIDMFDDMPDEGPTLLEQF